MRGERAGPPAADETVIRSVPWEEAWLLTGRLQSDGIAARVFPDQLSVAYGRALHPSVDVVVPKDQLEEAQRILAEIEIE